MNMLSYRHYRFPGQKCHWTLNFVSSGWKAFLKDNSYQGQTTNLVNIEANIVYRVSITSTDIFSVVVVN